MHLTVPNLAHYLLARGLLDTRAVVGGDLLIRDASRRNRNFQVVRHAAPGLFVKQMREMQTDAMLTLKREAACYDYASGVPALARLMPRLIAYDAARHVLILELVAGAESLADYHAREKSFPTEIGALLGEGLGLYHAHAGDIGADPTMAGLFARQVPVVLTLGNGGHAMLGQFGHIGPALSGLIARHPEFQAALDALGAEWRFDSLIHGDMKWDNVLIFSGAEARRDFRIVDWELADLGDADWDVGAVLQSFLATWILSMPIGSGLAPQHYVGMAGQKLEAMRPVLHAFWDRYAETRGIAADQRRPALQRCMRYGAARLVWTALEQRLYQAELDAHGTALLQVAFNILLDPPRAVRELLDA